MRIIALVLALFFLVLLAPARAAAQPAGALPHYIARQTVVVRTMLCDTVDQIESVVAAQIADGVAAGRRTYLALRATPNAVNEPTCLIAWYRLTVLDVAAVFTDVPVMGRTRTTMYALHVLVGDTPYAILSAIPVGPPEFDV